MNNTTTHCDIRVQEKKMAEIRRKQLITGIVLVVILVGLIVYSSWSNIINMMMPADSRPERIAFKVEDRP